MQIASQNRTNILTALSKQGAFAFDVCFWLYFIKKDSLRFRSTQLFPKTEGILSTQRKIIIATKIVADFLRLIDVVGRKFPLIFDQQAIKMARITGLFFGALDGWNEQILAFKKLKNKFTVGKASNYLAHVFFNAFSVASIATLSNPLQNNSRPPIFLACMAACIVSSIIAKKFTKKTN